MYEKLARYAADRDAPATLLLSRALWPKITHVDQKGSSPGTVRWVSSEGEEVSSTETSRDETLS